MKKNLNISIHAPARGATILSFRQRYRLGISIRAPARGATILPSTSCTCSGFQSALPRGERPMPFLQEWQQWVFQSALPRGERRGMYGRIRSKLVFQSTLPRGERQSTSRFMMGSLSNFNPRSREGSDVECNLNYMIPLDFNPRSREGSDGIRSVRLHLTRYFNPRSREGSDGGQAHTKTQLRGISIHAPARGATMLRFPSLVASFNFNPRSREGSDIHSNRSIGSSHISIHAPARGATVWYGINLC